MVNRMQKNSQSPAPAAPAWNQILYIPYPPYNPYQYQNPVPQQFAQIQQPLSHASPLPGPAIAPRQAQPQQPSSPIADNEEEILQDFFTWKIELYNDPAKRRRIADIKAIVLEEMWTLDHLKKMSDPIKAYYTQGRTAGIPYSILLAFNDDIHKFKQYYRTTLAPARALGHLGGGGFIS